MTPSATDLAYAVILGCSFGVGVWLMLSLAPAWGAASLSQRIAPYLRDITDPHDLSAAPATPHDMRAAWDAVRTLFARLVGGFDSLERRLAQAAWAMDATAFRGRQLAWSIVGVAVGGVILIILVLAGRGSAAAGLLPPLCGLGAAAFVDALLTRAASTRVARIEDELPTLLEFLALCLSAGESILDSLRRVGDVGAGDLTRDIREVVLEVGTGMPLTESLERLAKRIDHPALTRSVDQLVAAIDRGAPLAHVLHAQALDAREDAKRLLLESAGRKEILMLLPLVFLILPLSVLFAVFPGVFMLRLGIG